MARRLLIVARADPTPPEPEKRLVAGLIVVHQESESFLAAVVRPDRRCVVAADRDADVTLETLADAAAEIRCE